MSPSTRLAALSLLLASGCHSAGLVQNATTTPRATQVEETRVAIEPHAGGFDLKLALNLPPAKIEYSAALEGRVVRVDIREGYYTEKCVDPYDVVIDVGPLAAGDYDVVIWESSPWMDATEVFRTRATVPAAPGTERKSAGVSSFRGGGCR